jgi:hypothetical protein
VQFYIPDSLTAGEAAFIFTADGYGKIMAELFQTRMERDTAQGNLETANGLVGELQGQLNAETARANAADERAANADRHAQTLNDQLKMATDRVTELAKLLEEAQKPTPSNGDDVWPDEPPFSIEGLAAFTVEKGQEAPDKAQYTRVREALFWAWDKKLKINAWRGHLNIGEVRDHLKDAPPLGHLPNFGRRLKMHFIADTVDVVVKSVDNTTLQWYLQSLEDKLKACAFVLNDADQYGIEGAQHMIERMRQFTQLPIILSLRGTANVAAYKALGENVFIEIQTFGKPDEMKNTFLPKAPIVDFFCFPAFKAMTAQQLKTIYDIVLAAKVMPKAFFFYTDAADDWPAMPQTEVDVLRNFVTRWKSAA